MSTDRDNRTISRRLDEIRHEIAGFREPVTARDLLHYCGYIRAFVDNMDEFTGLVRARVLDALLEAAGDHRPAAHSPRHHQVGRIPESGPSELAEIAAGCLEMLVRDYRFQATVSADQMQAIETARKSLRQFAG